MRPTTVAMLRSPFTHEPLRLVSEPGGASFLEGVESGARFPIERGLPDLLDQAQVSGYNLRYQRFYDSVAPLYDRALALGARLARLSEEEVRASYIARLDLEPGDRLLEVSIGTGSSARLLPDGIEHHGLDISRGMLRRAQRNLARCGREAELTLGNAEELPYLDGQFDAVLHVGGINAFSDRGRAIAEMVRVARSGARIVIVDETAALIRRLAWFPGARRLLQRHAERFEAPVDLVPETARQVEVTELMRGGLYCLSFTTG